MHLQLFDRGYDIWMGNNRGTKYSNFNPKFPESQEESFERWDFSWEELGMYDVPAFMDKIIEINAGISLVVTFLWLLEVYLKEGFPLLQGTLIVLWLEWTLKQILKTKGVQL